MPPATAWRNTSARLIYGTRTLAASGRAVILLGEGGGSVFAGAEPGVHLVRAKPVLVQMYEPESRHIDHRLQTSMNPRAGEISATSRRYVGRMIFADGTEQGDCPRVMEHAGRAQNSDTLINYL